MQDVLSPGVAFDGWAIAAVGLLFAGIGWFNRKKIWPFRRARVAPVAPASAAIASTNPDYLKVTTHILFVDDETDFRVVKILKREGWLNTRIVRDITSLDSEEVRRAGILFIDIHGVGSAMGFSNEGLGLVTALKNRYGSQKKVVIYSAEPSGDRFDDALRKADDVLRKNADPYQFIQVVERLAAQS